MSGQIRVTVWNEYVQERESPEIHDIYPEGIHGCLRGFLEKERDITVTCVTLDMPRQGITRELLDETDVLIWWSHARQEEVTDETVRLVQEAVWSGMGRIFYFQPGHEEAPVYEQPEIQRIIVNAVRWAEPTMRLNAPPQNVGV